MPIYLVRWPGLVAALVSADDEDDLMDILDETANPEGCTWSVYDGPICIEFALNASVAIDEPDQPRERPLDPDDVKLADVSRICDHDLMTAEIPAFSDTAADMVDAIVSAAFPALKRVVDGGEEPLPEDKVRMALRDELDALVKASWRHEQTKRRVDPESRMAAHLGTSPRLIAHWNKRARTRPAPKKPKRPTGKRKLKKPK